MIEIPTIYFLEELICYAKSRDAGSYLTSKFLSRPDTKDIQLPDFIDWALNLFTSGIIHTYS